MEEEKDENKCDDVRVNLDTILQNEIGPFGCFQVKLFLLAGLVAIFIGWSASEYLFTAARIPTRCVIPECEDREATTFVPAWTLNAIPSSGNSFDNCNRFQPLNLSQSVDETCPKDKFNREETIPCDEFIYENTHTVVYDIMGNALNNLTGGDVCEGSADQIVIEMFVQKVRLRTPIISYKFGLACEEWRRSLIGTARTVGGLVAMPITGFVSDRFGRRTAIIVTGVNAAWLGLIRYWSRTYVGFVISEFAESVFSNGGFSALYILLMEMTEPKYRVTAGAIQNTFFAAGQITEGLIAWAVPNWRNLTLVLYIPQFITIAYIWILPESVRWYMSKGRYNEAENTLKIASRNNKNDLSEITLKAFRKSAEKEKRLKEFQAAQLLNEPWLPVQVFRHKVILHRLLLSLVWWITLTFVYYGLSINAVNMVGNRYLNFVLVSAVEIPGYWSAVFLLGKAGRKPVLVGAYWMCALCQVAYIFIPDDLYAASLSVYLIGKYSISVVATSMYVFTAELYPTKYRHGLFAFSSMIGRIGSIVAPLTPAIAAAVWDGLPFAMFGSFALLSGALMFLAPETRGIRLADTMEEASNIGSKK